MGLEIERKFLVTGDGWKSAAHAVRHLRQGYLAIDDSTNVRVRTDGERAWLTIKAKGEGISRPEFEYEIPAAEAAPLLQLCRGRTVEKMRHLVSIEGLTWEVDQFLGENAGLIMAELELDRPDQDFRRPEWVGEEVSADHRYHNASLAMHPYARWPR